MPERPLSEQMRQWAAPMPPYYQNLIDGWIDLHEKEKEAENARLRRVYEVAAEVLPMLCGVVDGNVWCARCGVIDPRAGDEHEQDCIVCALDDAVREAVTPLVEASESGQGFIRTDARKNPAVREARDADG